MVFGTQVYRAVRSRTGVRLQTRSEAVKSQRDTKIAESGIGFDISPAGGSAIEP